MSVQKLGVGAAVVVASAALVVGGSALANAAGRSSVASGSAGYGAAGSGTEGTSGARGPGGAGRQGSADTPVTGDELAKVTAAMKAKDAAVTVTQVRKDPDGSYDVLGTKAGVPVFYDVSADLTTFTLNAGGGRGAHGGRGPGGGTHTPVTGDELAKVTAAVTAKDAAVSVERVQKDPDGSYDVFGTKAGARVMLEVSKDLATVTQGPARSGPPPQQPAA